MTFGLYRNRQPFTKGAFMQEFSFLLVALIFIGCGVGGGGGGDSGNIQTPAALTLTERATIKSATTNIVSSVFASANSSAKIPNGTMSWVVADKFDDGSNVNFKFFDRANNWVWPGATEYYYTSAINTSYQKTLSCSAGGTVCIGAQSQSGQYSWGVGLDGKSGCTACCAPCDGKTYSYNFTSGTQAASVTAVPLLDSGMHADAGGIKSSGVAERAIHVASVTVSLTDCDPDGVCHSATAAIFNEYVACPLSGRSNTNGNLKVSDTGAVSGMFTTQFSDPTNNLYDCQVANDVYVKGSITVTISGNANTCIKLSLNTGLGLEIARRGPTGGLIPIDSIDVHCSFSSPDTCGLNLCL